MVDKRKTKTMNKEPRQFTNFDDFDNDGWGNSTIEPRYIPEETDLEDETPEPDHPSESIVVVNNFGSMETSNTENK